MLHALREDKNQKESNNVVLSEIPNSYNLQQNNGIKNIKNDENNSVTDFSSPLEPSFWRSKLDKAATREAQGQ